jgi:uncharacterized protein YecE (DUF72 family)
MFSHAAPVLPVDNAVASAEFYRDQLGFQIEFMHGDPPYYAIVSRDNAVTIHFSEREDTSKKIHPCSVYIFVNDVEAVYEEYKSKGMKMFSPPEDQDTRARHTRMKYYVGTSGYSYDEWKGNFYPEKIASGDMLHYYGEKLPSVEINNTFYRMPKASMLETWASQVPESFRFVVKASRRITHIRRLANAKSETEYLLETTATLGERLGAILFQLPPNMKKNVDRLDDFLDTLPKGTRAAFEFRHDTWFGDDVYDLLRKRNCALCIADTEDGGAEVISTADWGYLRLRRPEYRKPALQKWLESIQAQKWAEVYVFFKHEDAGAGPRLAARLLELAP